MRIVRHYRSLCAFHRQGKCLRMVWMGTLDRQQWGNGGGSVSTHVCDDNRPRIVRITVANHQSHDFNRYRIGFSRQSRLHTVLGVPHLRDPTQDSPLCHSVPHRTPSYVCSSSRTIFMAAEADTITFLKNLGLQGANQTQNGTSGAFSGRISLTLRVYR